MRRMYSLKQLEEIANARVKSLVEGGTLDNAKPLYYHPLALFCRGTGDETPFALSFTILNNSPTPFTTLTFIQWVKDLLDSIIESGGGHVNLNTDGGYGNIVSCAYIYVGKAGDEYQCIPVGFDKNGDYAEGTPTSIDELFDGIDGFTDGVNKIN